MILSLIFIFFSTCKKDEQHKNAVIKGHILNLCTDKGLANIEVNFREVHKKRFNKYEKEEFTAYSDADGNFKFTKTIHMSDDYKYYMSVPSNPLPTDSVRKFESISSTMIEKSELLSGINVGLSPSFYKLRIYILGANNIHQTDTLSLHLYNKIVQKNILGAVSDFKFSNLRTISGSDIIETGISEYRMGTWCIDFYKIKNGVATTLRDSIYLDIGGSKSYTIEW